MDQDLQRLTSQLRQERCPPRVMDAVTQRIRAQRPNRGHRLGAMALATTALVLISTVAVWFRPSPKTPPLVQPPVQANLERTKLAAETEGALGYIGSVLLNASTRTERIVLNQAVPPFRNSLATAREKLLNHIEP
ncbi:MAG TPA: hypothetical protein VHI52_06705 [Verrucomicrobiae bacterium]|nr:hypothetical protein [Verrucomicrobiae bacterium]